MKYSNIRPCLDSVGRLASIEAFKPGYPGFAAVTRDLEELPHPTVGKRCPKSSKRRRDAIVVGVDYTRQQHAIIGHATTNIDVVSAGSDPELNPLVALRIEIIDARAGAASGSGPVLDQDTTALLAGNCITALVGSGRIVHVPLANPEIERGKSLILLARVGRWRR